MAADDMIVGLDIGTSKVTAAVGEYNESGELEIVGIGTSVSSGLRRGVVINIEATLRSVLAAVEAAEQMAGREVQSVVTGIAGSHIEGLNSRGVVAVTGKGREITEADVTRVIDAAKAVSIPMDREILHVIPRYFTVDDQDGVRNPLDKIGVRLEVDVHIVTGSVTAGQNLVKCVNRAGFKVDSVVFDSFAAAEAVLLVESRCGREEGLVGTVGRLQVPDGATVYVCGHGLGGAIAQIVGNRRRLPLVTFNAPGVGVIAGNLGELALQSPLMATLRAAGSALSVLRHPVQAAQDAASLFHRVQGTNVRLATDPVSLIGIHYGRLATLPYSGSDPHGIATMIGVLEDTPTTGLVNLEGFTRR